MPELSRKHVLAFAAEEDDNCVEAYHTPTGMGTVYGGLSFSTPTDTAYDGPVSVEIEDRTYEVSLEGRKASLGQRAMCQFFPRQRDTDLKQGVL